MWQMIITNMVVTDKEDICGVLWNGVVREDKDMEEG